MASTMPARLAGRRPCLTGTQMPSSPESGAQATNIGSLGGPNAQAGTPNGRDEMPVLSELSTPDPLKEDFCGFGDHLICRRALWNGTMTPLPTLGGTNAMALDLNNRGQIIGVAEK